jgi:predicted amidophosphoribosyltransferase
VIACPNCGKDNPEGARFCNDCATPLAEASRPQAEERKVITVLFCDLVAVYEHQHERTDHQRDGGQPGGPSKS